MNSVPHADPRLVMPPEPPRYIERPRLLAELDRGEHSALTLVSAGPGAGKTALVSGWARARTAPTAWLAVTPADDDPRRFWRLFLAALRAGGIAQADLPVPATGTATMDLLDSLSVHVPESADPAVLVVDDAHVLRHPDILDGLDTVVRGWQPRLRLVLAARSDPLLPLHRYRLSGQVHELRAADLAMTPSEARELMAVHDLVLPDHVFELLIKRTEGWTAGLRLSALRMEGTERPADFVAEFALDEGSIGEYLMHEVLERQSDEVRQLLVETSFLPEVTGPLARAVTGIDNAGQLLADLARANSFVVPLDREYSRFRCHQLMTEILSYLLERRSPDQIMALFGRAASWFDEQGESTEALRWHVRAGDEAAAAAVFLHGGLTRAHVRGDDLVAAGVHEFVRRGESGAAPPSPEVAIFRALMSLEMADAATSPATFAGLAALLPGDAQPDRVIAARIAELRLARRSGDWPRVESAASALLQDGSCAGQVAALPGLRAALLLAQASSRFWRGEVEDVAALLRAALQAAKTEGTPELQVEILSMSALADTFLSRPYRAAQARQRAIELLDEVGEVSTPATLDLADALHTYVSADFDSMAGVLRRITATGAIESDAGIAGSVALSQAAILAACGQGAEAREILRRSPALGARATGLVAMQRDAALADLETALGRPNGALRLLDRYRTAPLRDRLGVHRARAYLELGDLPSAESCVRSVLTSTSPGLIRFTIVEALLCDAHIASRHGDEPRCMELLVRAMELADGDLVLPFVRMADVFAPILARHVVLAAEWPVAPHVETVITSPVSSGLDLADPLTERERAVLRYLATSMSTAEIAQELYLSVNTVKTHLAAIYRKLAARRRRDAVLRARELELL